MKRPGAKSTSGLPIASSAPVVVGHILAKDARTFTNPFEVSESDLTPSKAAVTLAPGDFDWKAKAIEALNILNAGESLVLVGSAGTGKSTLILDWLKSQIVNGRLPPVLQESEAYYRARHIDPVHSRVKPGSPGFIMGALSHRVTQRLARDLPALYTYVYKGVSHTCTVHNNVMTMHKATEYKPTQVKVPDKKSGEMEDKIHFVPTRGSTNPIPDIKLVILDEAGQIRLDLGRAIVSACPGAQVILMGDLGQVGAVASLGMLGVAIATTNAVELDYIYRSKGALLAWGAALREGAPYKLTRGGGVQNWNGNAEVAFLTYDRAAITAGVANVYCANVLFALIKKGRFTFGVDMALCPQVPTPKPQHAYEAEKFGVAGIWASVAEKLDRHYGRHTYLIRTMAGPKVVAAGDTYIVGTEQGQQEFMLMGLTQNLAFKGLIEYPPRLYDTRDAEVWVDYINQERAATLDTPDFADLFSEVHEDSFDMENQAELTAAQNAELSEAKSQYTLTMLNLGAISAHVYGVHNDPLVADKVIRSVVKALEIAALQMDADTNGAGIPYTLAELNNIVVQTLLAYKLDELVAEAEDTLGLITQLSNTAQINTMIPSITTVHKAQGSEAPLVVCMWHHSAIGQNRELLYTGNTRARLKVVNICDADTFGQLPDTDRTPAIERQSVKGTSLAAKRLTYKRKILALSDGPEADNAAYLTKFFKGESNGH